MSLVEVTQQRCPELARFFEDCCTTPLNFDGHDPLSHSSHNHVHLWALEWWADHHSWIDLDYRTEFANEIFKRWRTRLKGMPPYKDQGYRLYLYEDKAPTLSVVAETPVGFPYPGQPVFVNQRRQIMELYVNRSWRAKFEFEPFEVSTELVLAQVEKASGSISKPTANALGVKVGALRTLIEQMGLETRVNDIRKKYKRRPAKFAEPEQLHTYHIHEQRIEPGFA